MPIRTLLLAATLVAAIAMSSLADEVKYVEENGVTYRETKQVIPQVVTETRLEPREVTVYREKITTDLKQIDRPYQVPITEYQWVPGWQRSWNPFAPPVLTYRLMQVKRFETRTESVQIPVTNRQIVPEKLTQQVPVSTQRVLNNTYISRVAVGTKPAPAGSTGDPFANESATARRETVSDGAKLDSDPPRDGSMWRAADSGMRR